jgi:hypothetical protein
MVFEKEIKQILRKNILRNLRELINFKLMTKKEDYIIIELPM